jgi:hypothetical protein
MAIGGSFPGQMTGRIMNYYSGGQTEEEKEIVMDAIKGFPLAGKVPGRAALLKGFGNAIVPELAAEFIRAVLGSENNTH